MTRRQAASERGPAQRLASSRMIGVTTFTSGRGSDFYREEEMFLTGQQGKYQEQLCKITWGQTIGQKGSGLNRFGS